MSGQVSDQFLVR